jgi:hypothetical protein
VALAGEGASQRKSGFAEMVDTDRIQKRADLTCGFFLLRRRSPKRGSPNVTTHAHVSINCHSAGGADKRPCTSWFLLI